MDNKKDEITSFSGKYKFLSNFYPVWIKDKECYAGGYAYPSAEHLFQACKTFDENEQKVIWSCTTASLAKKEGKNCTLRDDWDDVKLDIMEEIVLQKFIQYPDLEEKLLATGDVELIEGNRWGDTFWGMSKGEGRNELGKILMKVRETCRNER